MFSWQYVKGIIVGPAETEDSEVILRGVSIILPEYADIFRQYGPSRMFQDEKNDIRVLQDRRNVEPCHFLKGFMAREFGVMPVSKEI